MASTNDIILQQYNSSGNWDEKLITPESGKVLGFDASLNPVQLSKQDTLVSGSNIKTINGNSLLGSGNIVAGSDWTNIKILSQSITGTIADISNAVITLSANQNFIIKMLLFLTSSTTNIYVKPSVNMTYSGYVIDGATSNTGNEVVPFSYTNNSTENNIFNGASIGLHEIKISGKCLGTGGTFKFRANQFAGGTKYIERIVIDYILF